MNSEHHSWFAVRVRSRCEKLAATELAQRGFEVFPAAAPQRRVWIDRVRVVTMPLFAGYIFAKFSPAQRPAVEACTSIASVVRFGRQDVPVEPRELDAIRLITGSGLEVVRDPLLRVGALVRVRFGPLKGAQGTLVELKGEHQLVVSVSILQRSVAVAIDEAMVEMVRTPMAGAA